MDRDLFSQAPEYTIDSSSLIDIFENERMVSRHVTPGLWERVEALIRDGIIVSHVEVLAEIRKENGKGEDLYDWAHANKAVFKDYDWALEPPVIRQMSPKYASFVGAKVNHIHADPWLVAQAKSNRLKVISEERISHSADPRKHKLPNVCQDPSFGVVCIDLLGLVRERGWTFR
jgi:hypothetical protein